MFVYSKSIGRFVHDIKETIKQILQMEIRLVCRGDRFYDRSQKISYPISVVIYNHKAPLGYFDAQFYELGFHERLMHSSKEQLHQIIRHELAHYMTFINHGPTEQPHSAEFKEFCQKMGWGEEVYRASICLDHEQTSSEWEEDGVFRKVKKLMALTASSHPHEAEQAMIKSQQLLLKHNLESEYVGSVQDEKIFMKRIMQQKKETAKMRAIGLILKTFFVNIVYNRGGGITCLEILGNAVNIEIAEYVANVLDTELEKFWTEAQKNARLKGAIAKNSFFLGIAKGYCNKIQALKKEYTQHVTNALVVLEKKLTDAQSLVYPRLCSKKSTGSYCPTSSKLGEKIGQQLNINPALNKQKKNSEEQLEYFSAKRG
jgi:predicted SprT family Zn-dependent metalloprotease